MANPVYYGKYRAIVVDIKDPEKRGRIKVKCPKVLGEYKSSWCEPCIPVAYDRGGDFCLPKVGETVWIEFEEGEVDKPIYVGSWWSTQKTLIPEDYYVNSPIMRTIEFDGGKIEIKSNTYLKISLGGCLIEEKIQPDLSLSILCGNSKILMTNNGIKMIADRIDVN